MTRARLTLGLLIGLSASGAGGQLTPKVYCLPSGGCYAASFQFTDYLSDPVPYTALAVHFQNLQGTFPTGGVPLALNWMMLQFAVSNEDPGPGVAGNMVCASPCASPLQQSIPVGSVRIGEVPVPYSNYQGPFTEVYWSVGGGGIVGCTQFDPYFFNIRTCPAAGLNGWARFNFQFRWRDGEGGLIAEPVRFTNFGFHFGSMGAACTIGNVDGANNCREFDYSAVVTPEPATISLLALGLAGVAAAARKRRRDRSA